MASFNQVTLLGNLTRDPQRKQLPGNTTVTEFGLAMNRKFRTAAGEDREEVTFVDCAAFGKAGEIIAQWTRKGSQLLISGRLKYDSWEDRQSGTKRSKLSIVVEEFQFVGSREDGGGEHRQQSAPPRGNGGRQRQDDSPFNGQPAGGPQFAPADIPF